MISLILSLIFHICRTVLSVGVPNKFPPPLSAAQEREEFLRLAEGDEGARERLILHNLRLVSHIVRKYYGTSPESEDLTSIGTVGLVKAVDTFRLEGGTRFATYGARCIQNEILMYFRTKKRRAGEVSLAETIDFDRDGNPLTYMDVICTNEDLSEEFDRKTQLSRALRLIKSVLDERERRIISMRYGILGSPRVYTQNEIAEKLAISRSYVSRLEKKCARKAQSAHG